MTIDIPFDLIVFTDGASRGNPGRAGAGWVLVPPKPKQPICGHAFLGHKTNNEAEYTAVILALTQAHDLGAKRVALCSDSELLVRQLLGEYQVKNQRLRPLYQHALTLIQSFLHFSVQHIPRDQNKIADRQANLAIDEANT